MNAYDASRSRPSFIFPSGKHGVHLQPSAHRLNEVLESAEVDIRALLQLRDRRLRHVKGLRELLLCQVAGRPQFVQRHPFYVLVGETSSFGPRFQRHPRPKFTDVVVNADPIEYVSCSPITGAIDSVD